MGRRRATRRTDGGRRSGSALILVIVLTVLLSLVGVLFVMVSRLGEMSTSTLAAERDLDAGVQAVVERIETVLMDDLFGRTRGGRLCDGTQKDITAMFAPLNEAYDFPGREDRWLADIEPVYDTRGQTDIALHEVGWKHLTDLYYDVPGVDMRGSPYGIGFYAYEGLVRRESLDVRADPVGHASWADADGDGVWDSLWVRVPGLVAGDGRPIWAAVRIVDNCGMLNLNTAHSISADSEGYYLSAVDYERFLRGKDRDALDASPPDDVTDPSSLRRARRMDGMFDPAVHTARQYHEQVLMHIENPNAAPLMMAQPAAWQLFTIGDELEIRNRLMLTSLTEARFERPSVAYYTFDFGNGFWGSPPGGYPSLRVPRIPFDNIAKFKWRVDPANFDGGSGGDPVYAWGYDRRHVCTFYSFDRNVRSGRYPLLVKWNAVNGWWAPLEHAHFFMPPHGAVVSVAWDFLKPTNHPLGPARGRLEKRQRQQVLWLLYAFRAYFMEEERLDVREAARRSAQVVANLIDFMDSAETPGIFPGQDNRGGTVDQVTRIDRNGVGWLTLQVTGMDLESDPEYAFGLDDADVVYGYERQPFITGIYCRVTMSGVTAFGVELANPYDSDLDLAGWRIRLGSGSNRQEYVLPGAAVIPAGSPEDPTRFVIRSDTSVPVAAGLPADQRIEIANFGLSLGRQEDIVELQRFDPFDDTVFFTVDQTPEGQLKALYSTTEDGGVRVYVSRRSDEGWKFANASENAYVTDEGAKTLGSSVAVTVPESVKGYPLPVADGWTSGGRWYGTEWVPADDWPYATLGRFEKVLWVGSDAMTDPNAVAGAITTKIGLAAAEGDGEGDLRYDIDAAPELLGYVGFVGRPEGRLPGRININTATREVIRAAIPPDETWIGDVNDLSQWVVERRKSQPFTSVAELLEVTGFQRFMDPNNVGPADADATVEDDFEERDWILSRVSNIFTVRSDVFTAYIAVRIGTPTWNDNGTPDDPRDDIVDNGADRRMIAIFDRSQVAEPWQRPRVVALHSVPDPR